MQNRWLYIALLAAGSLFVTSGVHDVASNAAPLGSTGAPGENTCAKSGCHTGSAINSGMALLSVDCSNAMYEPNEVYSITVSLQQSNIHRFGFQLLALNNNNESTGTFLITDSARTQTQTGTGTYTGRHYVTYKYAGTEPFAPGVGKWSFQWKAPAAYEGAITFYTAAVAADNDGTDAGDTVYTKQISLQAATTGFEDENTSKLGFAVFPNPTSSRLIVQYTSSKTSDTQIMLTDLSARNVFVSAFRSDKAGEQVAMLDVLVLPSGIYLLKIVSGNNAETQKVMIAK
ncbi:MAG: T9SS type A sorting domain-containing protein [Chitinophagales bacterium]|nr:T9SS type A sorting domain-containing protein [Chitinophagales bacterium]